LWAVRLTSFCGSTCQARRLMPGSISFQSRFLTTQRRGSSSQHTQGPIFPPHCVLRHCTCIRSLFLLPEYHPRFPRPVWGRLCMSPGVRNSAGRRYRVAGDIACGRIAAPCAFNITVSYLLFLARLCRIEKREGDSESAFFSQP